MGLKVCIEPGCFKATAGTRCADHEREWQRARNQRKGLAYNRRAYRRLSTAGAVCACCGGGDDLTRHHVIPLAYSVAEPALPDWARGHPIVAMCRRCNSSVADRFMLTRECPMHGGTVGGT